MRRKGTSEQLAAIRVRGLALLEQGRKRREVAEILDVSIRTVFRWQREAKHPKKKRMGPLGRPRKLSDKQVQRLEKALDRGAYAFGYAENYWTLDRIGQVIWQLFEVRYTTSAVWHVMQRMGWSSQRPQRVPLERDDGAIEQWKEDELPRIKKVPTTGRYPHSGG
jgi:transposase